jgi:hypothetical protein
MSGLNPSLVYSAIKTTVSDDRSHMLMLEYEKLLKDRITNMPRYLPKKDYPE